MLNAFRGGQASLAAAIRLLWLTAISLMLAGCSPPYNWREIRPEAQGFAVLMPAKTAAMNREIDLDGLRVSMSMVGARVDASLFTVGVVDLDRDAIEQRGRALTAMRVGMLRNVAASTIAERAIELPIVDASGRTLSRTPALRVDARGRVGGQPIRMSAIFVSRGERLWQAVAIEPEPGGEPSATMIDSFRLLE
jgi:hypothetical protein